MDHLRDKIKGPLKTFVDCFGQYLSDDDMMQFYSNRTKGDKHTFLSSDFRHAEKMSVVMLEEYEARGKLRGNVLLALPSPDYGLPIFNFQLGGNGVQSIALLDLSSVLPGTDYSPLIPVYEKYRDLLGIEPTSVRWVSSICSPYLLHCHYQELDTELFLQAMREYLEIWIEHYYEPAMPLSDERQVEIVTNALYKFKYVLHSNDPAYGIFKKEWGRSVADAFFDLETRDEPPLEGHPQAKTWENEGLDVLWSAAAQAQVCEAPESVQPKIRAVIEERAAAAGFVMITPDVFERYKG